VVRNFGDKGLWSTARRGGERWCMVCGEKAGICDHNSNTTNDIILGYNVWRIYNSEALRRATKELQRRKDNVRTGKTI